MKEKKNHWRSLGETKQRLGRWKNISNKAAAPAEARIETTVLTDTSQRSNSGDWKDPFEAAHERRNCTGAIKKKTRVLLTHTHTHTFCKHKGVSVWRLAWQGTRTCVHTELNCREHLFIQSHHHFMMFNTQNVQFQWAALNSFQGNCFKMMSYFLLFVCFFSSPLF